MHVSILEKECANESGCLHLNGQSFKKFMEGQEELVKHGCAKFLFLESVTRSLTLVSFERVSYMEYDAKYSVIAKGFFLPKTLQKNTKN